MAFRSGIFRLLGAMGFCVSLMGGAAKAGDTVVIELYTSQGCSSCPPADAILSKLSQKPDVIALALHVDYWDYIGWADSFARPEHTKRQRAYAHKAGQRTIYTPQMVIGGIDHVVGARPMDVYEILNRQKATPAPVKLKATRDGEEIVIQANPVTEDVGLMVVQLVRYEPAATVDIKSGENAGQTITYANIVLDWQRLGEWSGDGPLTIKAPAPGKAPAVVILQRPGPGAIVAATRVD